MIIAVICIIVVLLIIILDLLVKTGAETPQKQENATL